MSLFIATGTNLGDKKANLIKARIELQKHFDLIAESRIYHSKAVDYEDQDDFYNQVLEFKVPNLSPDEIMKLLLKIEIDFGRTRDIAKGPRIIDLDILFISDLKIQTDLVNLPHPRLMERSFVVLPLSELPGFIKLKNSFNFPTSFSNQASPISL